MKTILPFLLAMLFAPYLHAQNTAEVHEEKAAEHAQNKEWDMAISEYGTAIRICADENNWEKWLDLCSEQAFIFFQKKEAHISDSIFLLLENKATEKGLVNSPAYVKLKLRHGNTWSNRGKQPKAIAEYEKALEIYQNNKNEFQETYPELFYEAANAYARNRNLKKALNYFQIGLGEASNINDKKKRRIWEYHFRIKIGEKKVESGNTSEGISELKTICGELENEQYADKDEAEIIYLAFSVYGVVLARNQEFEAAIDWLNRSEVILMAEFADQYNKIASANNFLGICYLKIQEYERGISHLEKAKKYYSLYFNPRHPSVASVANNLGIAYDELGDFENAMKCYHESLSIRRNFFGDDHRMTGQSMLNIGNDLWKNDQCDSSIIYHKEAARIYRNHFGENHLRTAAAYMALAKSWAKCAEIDSAFLNMNYAISAIADDFSETYRYTENPSFEELKNAETAIDMLQNKMEVLNMAVEKRPAEKKELLAASLATAQLTHELLWHKKQRFDFQALSKASFFRRHHPVYKNAVSAAVQLFELTNEDTYFSDAIFWAEAGKSLLLLEAYQGAEAQNDNIVPQELMEEEKRTLDSIVVLEQKILSLKKEGNITEADIVEGNELFEQKERYTQFQEKLKNEFPAYYQLKYDLEFSTPLEIGQVLDDKSLLIEFVQNIELNHWAILTIDNEGNKHSTIVPTINELNEKTSQLNRLLKSPFLARKDKRKKFVQIAEELYGQFIRPIENYIAGKEKLIIVGEGITNYIPFEILLKKAEDEPFEQLDFLIREHEISYHYSATLFQKNKQKEKREFESDLLAFAPVFVEGDEMSSTMRAGVDTTLRAFTEGGNYAPLPFTEKEVMGISELFSKKNTRQNLNLLREKAREGILKENMEKGFRHIHLASHSFVNITEPKFSGIACTNMDKASTKEDGMLHIGEIYNLDIKSDLVVLSSCESGVGRLESGEGMIGLNRSFIYAGVPNVVFSLWKVNDKTTSEFMVNFYSEILKGNNYSTALRNVKLDFLKNASTASPNLWAAFLIMGGQ